MLDLISCALERRPTLRLGVWVAALLAACATPNDELPFATMANRIVQSLDPAAGERAMLRYNPGLHPTLVTELVRALADRGVIAETMSYDPVPGFVEALASTDIYVWLPAGNAVTSPEELAALIDWLDTGRGRQVHFHWGAGTVHPDGLGGEHSDAYDRVYVNALDIDYGELARRQMDAIQRLQAGSVTITTPAGTDIRFRVGDRPFNRQDGDASRQRMREAKIRIDREIELPAGVVRVAPVERSVDGVIVIPSARVGDMTVTSLRLVFEQGQIVDVAAADGADAFRRTLATNPSFNSFREFALGFNPELVIPDGGASLPYFGYGAGVVRMSLGDNAELGGTVRGGGARWFFFPDATVTVGDDVLVQNGTLQPLSAVSR